MKVNWLRDLSIKKKIQLIITATSCLVLTIAFLALAGADWMVGRRTLVADVSGVADIVAANSTAALMFDDPASAEEILGALQTRPHVLFARLATTTGRTLAAYDPSGQAFFRDLVPLEFIGDRFEGQYLALGQTGFHRRRARRLASSHRRHEPGVGPDDTVRGGGDARARGGEPLHPSLILESAALGLDPNPPTYRPSQASVSRQGLLRPSCEQEQ